jgi:hypothetical protein
MDTMDTVRRMRLGQHTCDKPVLVAIDDYGGWRYVGIRPGEFIARCPWCRRRLTRRTVRLLDADDQ